MRDARLKSTGGFKLKAGRVESILPGCLKGLDQETEAQVEQLVEADWGELMRALRWMGDIDLLVRRPDLAGAAALLRGLGYSWTINWARHREATADRLRQELRQRRLRAWLKPRSGGGD